MLVFGSLVESVWNVSGYTSGASKWMYNRTNGFTQLFTALQKKLTDTFLSHDLLLSRGETIDKVIRLSKHVIRQF